MSSTNKNKADEQAKDKCNIYIPEFRVSYPHVFKAKAIKDGVEPKFSITMLLKKSVDLTDLRKAFVNAKVAKWGPKDKWPKGVTLPIEDGDSEKFKGKEGYAGHWVLKASNKQDRRPVVVDKGNQPILDANAFYAGCYAVAKVYVYAWEFAGRYGISIILDGVQKTKEGAPLGSRVSADKMFAPIESDDDGGMMDSSSDEDEDGGEAELGFM